MRDLALLTAGDFESYVGSWFGTHYQGTETAVRLDQVGLIGAAGGAGRQPFSLLFRGPSSVPLPQQIHRLEHDGLGSLDLFLVPVGADGNDLLYEAIFA